ncbi:G-type lectin S-receptor-like serine/threonine-protein kinase SD1-1 [Ranunculus cassubicifolius]
MLGLGGWCFCKRRKSKGSNGNDDLELPLYDLVTIKRATDNFSEENELGKGGFGPVYKGTLEGGQKIAVKRLSKDSTQGIDEFENEVILIAKLQHRNLVRLLGYCIQGEEKMLLYEYMQNKSLDFYIFDDKNRRLLDWQKRFQILLGIARGLLYLHHDSIVRIIHRDLKASNVLLDSEMIPKISDFGLARICGGDHVEGNTKRVVGTFGYMSPEYAIDGHFSVKSDVFSFGVLVLEILSGKKNRAFSHPDHDHNLLGHAWILWSEDKSMELVDESMRNSCCVEDVLRCIHVALLCVQQSSERRPAMSSVLLMLSSAGNLPVPQPPGFYVGRSTLSTNISLYDENKMTNSNNATMTLLEGR